jgi:hypothetical protein
MSARTCSFSRRAVSGHLRADRRPEVAGRGCPATRPPRSERGPAARPATRDDRADALVAPLPARSPAAGGGGGNNNQAPETSGWSTRWSLRTPFARVGTSKNNRSMRTLRQPGHVRRVAAGHPIRRVISRAPGRFQYPDETTSSAGDQLFPHEPERVWLLCDRHGWRPRWADYFWQAARWARRRPPPPRGRRHRPAFSPFTSATPRPRRIGRTGRVGTSRGGGTTGTGAGATRPSRYRQRTVSPRSP